MNMENLKICVDDREPRIIDVIGKVLDITFERQRLKEGDYICGDVCIERKTIDDFCSSIMDGRLDSQVKRMKKKFDKVYVLVSGKIKDRSSEIHEHAILGKMASLVVKHGVSVISVDDDWQLCYLMKRIFERSVEEEKC